MTRKKAGFRNQKMLASRIELGDYVRFEELLAVDAGKAVKIQEVVNTFVRSVISGSIVLSGSSFVGGNPEEY